MLLSWLLRLILVLILLRLVFQFLRGLVAGMTGQGPSGQRQAGASRGSAAVPLVRDPVCGTYVVRSKALSAVAGSQTAWFCSEACRESWRASHAGSRTA
jgi:YHS domain-containing protein